MKYRSVFLSTILVTAAAIAYVPQPVAHAEKDEPQFIIQSPSFRDGQPLSTTFTCDGDGKSPALRWSESGGNVASYMIIMEDVTESKPKVHWIVYDLPSRRYSLPEGVPSGDTKIKDGGRQGTNDFNKVGYTPPCPDNEKTKKYRITLYSLDKQLKLPQPVTMVKIKRAMEGAVWDKATLTAVYRRQSDKKSSTQ